jgi:hypothetical protein
MVVVDQAKRALGKTIEVSVTSVLQTTAGKMIFCRWLEGPPGDDAARRGGTARNGRDLRPGERRDVERREGTWTDPTTAGTQPIAVTHVPSAEKHPAEPPAEVAPASAKVEPL